MLSNVPAVYSSLIFSCDVLFLGNQHLQEAQDQGKKERALWPMTMEAGSPLGGLHRMRSTSILKGPLLKVASMIARNFSADLNDAFAMDSNLDSLVQSVQRK